VVAKYRVSTGAPSLQILVVSKPVKYNAYDLNCFIFIYILNTYLIYNSKCLESIKIKTY